MSKTIIFCADGTWNGPDQDDNEDKFSPVTNVYKLFLCLAGKNDTASQTLENEQEKRLVKNGAVVQAAKYIHGVGDGKNPINKLIGGVFGAGTIKRIVRGYTFISREYEPGDRIVLLGFSRGAYTARALAGMMAEQGLLVKPLTTDKEDAYKWGARAWYYYHKDSGKGHWWTRLVGGISDLPGFLTRRLIKSSDFVSVDHIKAVAVWDTVGALGIPRYHKDHREDVFEFADTQLSQKVELGIHAVSLDEQRGDFIPTLWDQAANVKQMLFAGAHADVGGGYPTTNHESGLSDIALLWMVEQLKVMGLEFDLANCPPIFPNPAGCSHKPWQHRPFKHGLKIVRSFVGKGLSIHESIRQRMQASPVVQEPGESPTPYYPENLPVD